MCCLLLSAQSGIISDIARPRRLSIALAGVDFCIGAILLWQIENMELLDADNNDDASIYIYVLI